MIKNYFYLIVGLLCLLFAVTHTWNGLETVLPTLSNSEIDNSTKSTFDYVWHIIGAENFVFGIALILMAFYKDPEKVKFTAWLITAILILRWVVIASTTLKNEQNLKGLLPDTIAIFIVVVLLLLGIKLKKRN